ncbi:MAG: hypothetical protein ABEH78_10195 [Haloferacaceae archaeon]
MEESFRGDVLHTIAPTELDDYDLTADLRERAADDDRYVLVCRRGGHPSWAERIWAFVRRDPIEAVTIIADEEVAAGETITVAVEATDLAGVYRATTAPQVD